MEGILMNVMALEPGDILTSAVVLMFVFGRVLIDHRAEEEMNGKAASRTAPSVPEPDAEETDARAA